MKQYLLWFGKLLIENRVVAYFVFPIQVHLGLSEEQAQGSATEVGMRMVWLGSPKWNLRLLSTVVPQTREQVFLEEALLIPCPALIVLPITTQNSPPYSFYKALDLFQKIKNLKILEGKDLCLIWSLLSLQCLAYSRCSVNVCRGRKCMLHVYMCMWREAWGTVWVEMRRQERESMDVGPWGARTG